MIRPRRMHLLGLLPGFLLACSQATGPSSAERPPNVLVVTLDTLRADHLSFYGYGRETAPFLASVAGEGTVFVNAWTASTWTAPSTASLLTGTLPPTHGVTTGFFAHVLGGPEGEDAPVDTQALELPVLPEDLPTLAEVFAGAGYRTFGLATNVNIGPEMRFDRGFDRFERHDGWNVREVRGRLGEWLPEITATEPWFVYLHLNDAHWPYKPRRRWLVAPEEEGEREARISLYDSEIGYMDDTLAGIFADLGVDATTLVAVVSDHGEEFQDHGNWFHHPSLHGELARGVFVLRGPGLGIRTARETLQVSLTDLLPTLVELCGLESPKTLDGRSLADLARGVAAPSLYANLEARPIFAHRTGGDGGAALWSVVRGPWKLIVGPRGTRLYDLTGDPGEHIDLASSRPDVVERMQALLAPLLARGVRSDAQRSEIDLPPELLERLKALGYTR